MTKNLVLRSNSVPVKTPSGSTQALDHRRAVLRKELMIQGTHPLFLWPLLAALTYLL